MNGDPNIRDRAEKHFTMVHDRHEKGSALSLIAAEAKATDDKTLRLKALRMERDATVRPEAPKPARKIVNRTIRR